MNHKQNFIRSQLAILKPIVSKCSIETVRRGQESVGRLMARNYKDYVSIEYAMVGEMKCAMLTPKEELSGGVILYMHGGGYVSGNLDYALGFASMLAAKCGIRVFAFEYRLAPEHPYPAALDDAMDAYGYLLSSGYEPSRILLCGESAGGGLCYTLCQKLRDKSRTMPAGIVAISPWTDLTLSSPSYTINQKSDPSLTIEILRYQANAYIWGGYLGRKGRLYPNVNTDEATDKQAKRDPRVSPLFDSQEKMPDSLIFVGDDEILYDDAVLMHDALLKAGCKSELVIAPNLWHGYILYDLPSRAGDFDKISKFIRKTIPARKKLAWVALDNAAKIFPAARTRTWSNIFRISSTLNEDIDREVLRVALDVTIRRFPSIAASLKNGVFWYYHQELREAPPILDEKPYPTSRMTTKDLRKCAFRVLVYKNRLAVEFFHSLTDGTGGLIFVKTLTAEYLYQKYGIKVPTGNGILDRLEEPSSAELEDAFLKNAGEYTTSRNDVNAFRIEGKREPDGFRTNTTFIIDPDYVKAEAKKRGVTVTAYMTVILIEATRRIQESRVSNPAKYKPIKVFIPVNLRKMFPSETLRNFILYTTPGIDPRLGDYSFDDMCQIIAAQMKQQMTRKNMAALIRTNVGNESSFIVRIVPLFIKNIIMKIVFNTIGERKTCFSFSNLGVVNVPEEYSSKVERMDFVLGCQAIVPYNVSSITYCGKMYLNIIRNAIEPVFEREIYAVLCERGVPHTIESNTREREEK